MIATHDERKSDVPGTGDGAAPQGGERRRYGKVAKRGVAWSFLREGVSELITTPTAMILARLLTPFDFGVAASAVFFMSLAARLTNFGFNQALVRIKDLRPEHCSAVFVVSVGLGVAAYAFLAGTAELVGSFLRTPEVAEILPVAALTFVIVPFGTVPAALMSRNLQFTRTATADWANGLAEAASALAFAWAGYGYWSLVYGRLIGSAIGTAVKLVLGRWRPSVRFSRTALGDLLSFGTGVFAKRLLDYTARNLDNMVVARLLGVVALGFYDKAFVTVNKVLIRLNTGGPVISFRVFSIIQEEPERFRKAYVRVILAASLITYPALLGLAAIGPELIPLMYGDRWLPAVVPFQILCVAGMFRIMIDYAGSAIQATGKIWSQVGRQVIYTALVVVGVAVFSPWGLAGAAFGVLIATVVMYLLIETLLMQITSLSFRSLVEPQVPGLVCGFAVLAAVAATRWGLSANVPDAEHWQRFVIEGAAGAAAYIAFIKLNRFREVRRLVRDVAADLSPAVGRVVQLLV